MFMPEPAPFHPAADRNLLFGVLALQADLIDSGRFAEACAAWSTRKDMPLADLLVERGWLTPADRADVEKLLQRKLAKHKGDARASLAEVTTDHMRQSLAELTDPDIRQSLAGPTPPALGHVLVATTEFVPETRDRYTLSRLHATGGIGRVWLARDAALGRDVALKELRPERAGNPAVWARFLREAQVTGQLEHPGVVPIYEVGRRPDDQAPFYTMRFVRGRTLAEAVAAYHARRARDEAGPLELRELLNAFVGVCNAVAYAHSRGVLHRDLKPHNVVLGDYGEVVVLDWGLARLMDEPEGDAAPLDVVDVGAAGATVQGQVLGTPAYLSPEQAEGRQDLLGPGTDVYGLGAVLYEILVGSPPFSGPDTTEVLRRVRHQEPERPRSLVPGTPLALEAVCLKALAKKPGERYGTAKELAGEVQRWLADEPVSAWREPVRMRAGRWVRRHRTGVATALAALVVAVVGLLAVAAVQTESRRQLAGKNRELEESNLRLAAARDRAERRVDLALGAIENFRSAVDGNLDVKNRPENEGLRKTLLLAPLAFYQKLRDDLRDGGDSGPEARTKLADAYFQLGSLDRDIGSQTDALKAYDEAVTLLEALANETPQPQGPGLRGQLARALNDRGELQSVSKALTAAALESLRRARELRGAEVREKPQSVAARVDLARTLDDIALLEARKGDADTALATLREGLAELEQARGLESGHVAAGLLLARTHLQVSSVLLNHRSRLPESLASAQAALQIAEALVRAHPGDPGCQTQLSGAYEGLGSVHEAKGEYDKALIIYGKQAALAEDMIRARPTFTRHKLDRVDALKNVATAQYHLGNNAEGLETVRKARDLAESLVRENPTNIQFKRKLSAMWSRSATPLYALGRVAEALSAIESGAAVLEGVAQADPTDVSAIQDMAGAHYNCGILNKSLGRVEAALASYDKSLLLRERLVREHPDDPWFAQDVASTLGNVAVIHFERRHYPDARTVFQRALEILEKLAAAHPENAEYQNYLIRARHNLGMTLTKLGQTREALEILRAAQAPSERMAREHPGVVQYQLDLAHGLLTLGGALQKDGQADEAAAAYEKGIEVHEKLHKANPDDPQNRAGLVESLRYLGITEQERKRPAAAAKAYRRALEILGGQAAPSPEQLYTLACCHARLGAMATTAGSGLSADDGRGEADKALAALSRAVAAGYNDAEELRTDKDLDTLRQREDFKKLLTELKVAPAVK
jgi:serine/threonine-protein kinase